VRAARARTRRPPACPRLSPGAPRPRNGWAAAAAALRGWVEDAARRRGRGGAPPLSELPAPLPLSRFQWPAGQGKGVRAGYEKCGMCLHCTRPLLRKGCLNPTVRAPAGAPEAAAATAGKLQAAANYALRLERELHGLAGGPWDAPGGRAGHRGAWASRVRLCVRPRPRPCPPRPAAAAPRARAAPQVKAAAQPADVAAAVLELEAALRRSLLAPDWGAPPAGAPGAQAPPVGACAAASGRSAACRQRRREAGPRVARQAPAPASACWRTT